MQTAERISGVKGVNHLFTKKETKGIATISTIKATKEGVSDYNWSMFRNRNPWPDLFRMHEGEYVRLHIDGELMMSDTTMERLTNVEFIKRANGRVLIAGLGIGLVILNILNKKEVTEVIVMEKYQDVIDLVLPKFNSNVGCKKLKVIEGDVFDYEFPKTEKFDTIYFDIWPTISSDNVDEMKTLHKLYRKNLKRGGYMSSWMKKECQILKRRDY